MAAWSWSISAYGDRDSVVASITAQSYPTTETDGEGNVTQLTVDPNDVAQYQKAQAEVLAEVQAMPAGSLVAVGVSGNVEGYRPTVKQVK